MSEKITSLYNQYPKAHEIGAILIISWITLIAGLFLPSITLNELFFFRSTFSIITGIYSMLHEGHFVLGFAIIIFSIIFPIIKLTTLCLLWFVPMPEAKLEKQLHWLGKLGKWSMLDVFVVAITIVITEISHFASAHARIGIYFFGISIILSIIATMRLDHLRGKSNLAVENRSNKPSDEAAQIKL